MTIRATLFVSALFALIAAGTYTFVGWWLAKRVVSSSEGRLAWRAFTTWWFALAVTTLVSGFENLLGALGLTDLALFVTASYVNILITCVALWGLVYYLVYLFTGNSRSLLPLTLFYMIYYVFLVYYITASIPNNVEISRWQASLGYASSLSGPFFVLLVALLLIPQILGGLAYFTLYFRVTEATQKYRVLLVSWSIILWFVSPLIALAGGVSERDWWQLASRLIGLGAALAILMAYVPPRWLKQRFGVISLGDESRQG